MIQVNFYKNKSTSKENIDFVVVMARYNNKWIIARHQDRQTWEIPGGHVELKEEIIDAAYRELYEETGSKEATLEPVCVYSVVKDDKETYGQLYYGEVKVLGNLPPSEIKEIKFVDKLPNELTYPAIQPLLYDKVIDYLQEKVY